MTSVDNYISISGFLLITEENQNRKFDISEQSTSVTLGKLESKKHSTLTQRG